MGLFNVDCKVEHPTKPNKAEIVADLLVDTGSEFTWIDVAVLKRLGIEVRKTVQLRMANGQIITRPVGFAVLRVEQSLTVDEVIFARKGDLQLLGARSLEGLNLVVDPKNKRLVPGEPGIAASVRS